MSEQVQENTCGCGRSPTGQCCGWHGLSDEDFQAELKKYFESQDVKPE